MNIFPFIKEDIHRFSKISVATYARDMDLGIPASGDFR
jgi:hypothetical protein